MGYATEGTARAALAAAGGPESDRPLGTGGFATEATLRALAAALGGGSGGGGVVSVNGETGAVVLTLNDILEDRNRLVDRVFEFVSTDDESNFLILSMSQGGMSITNSGMNAMTSFTAQGVTLKKGSNSARLIAPEGGGPALEVFMPQAAGTLALRSDIAAASAALEALIDAATTAAATMQAEIATLQSTAQTQAATIATQSADIAQLKSDVAALQLAGA